MQSVGDVGFLPGGGANSIGGHEKLLCSQFFPKKWMKLKEFGPWEAHVLGTPLVPQLGFNNILNLNLD